MGRPEIPVNQSVEQQAALATWLRHRRERCGLTYARMAAVPGVSVSAATLKRAASGQHVPKMYVVLQYVLATSSPPVRQQDLNKAAEHAEQLWLRARYASQRVRYTTPGHYRIPDPQLVDDRADLSRALRELHAVSGAPAPSRMQITASGYGVLPMSTARRILEGRTEPGSINQFIGFLRACGVGTNNDVFHAWLTAFKRVRDTDTCH